MRLAWHMVWRQSAPGKVPGHLWRGHEPIKRRQPVRLSPPRVCPPPFIIPIREPGMLTVLSGTPARRKNYGGVVPVAGSGAGGGTGTGAGTGFTGTGVTGGGVTGGGVTGGGVTVPAAFFAASSRAFFFFSSAAFFSASAVALALSAAAAFFALSAAVSDFTLSAAASGFLLSQAAKTRGSTSAGIQNLLFIGLVVGVVLLSGPLVHAAKIHAIRQLSTQRFSAREIPRGGFSGDHLSVP